MRVGLYARLFNQVDVDNQLSDLRSYCSNNSFSSVIEYVDYQSNSGRSGRVQFNKMMTDVANQSLDLIIFWRLDKLSLDGVAKTLRYLRFLQSYNVNFRSLNEPCIDSKTDYRDIMFSIIAVIANQEHIRISEKTKMGLQKARSLGSELGRRKISLKTIKKINDLKKSGLSIREVARQLQISHSTARKYFNI